MSALAGRDACRARAVVALLAGLALGAATDARAATRQVVAAGAAGASIAVGADGRVFLVTPGARRVSAGRSQVRVRSARPGGRLGPPRTILRSRPGDRAAGAGVAADGRGVIVVQRTRGTRRRVRAVAFGAGGRLARAATLSRGGASDFAALDVAPSGAAVVVWFRHGRSGRWRLEAAIREPEARAFGPPRPVSAFVRRPCCTAVTAAIGDRGDAVVTWRSTSRPAVRAALRRPGGGAFARPQRLAADAADDPRAVVGADGTAAVLYSVQHVPLRAGDGLQVHRAPGGAPFGPAEHVNPGGGVTAGALTVTPAGRVVVAWVDTATASVRLSEAGRGEPLRAGAALGTGVAARGLAVAADDAGRAIVAWTERLPARRLPRQRTVAAMRPADGAPFGPAVALGRPWRAAAPAIARLLPGGGALVAWTGSRPRPPRARRTALAVTRLP